MQNICTVQYWVRGTCPFLCYCFDFVEKFSSAMILSPIVASVTHTGGQMYLVRILDKVVVKTSSCSHGHVTTDLYAAHLSLT